MFLPPLMKVLVVQVSLVKIPVRGCSSMTGQRQLMSQYLRSTTPQHAHASEHQLAGAWQPANKPNNLTSAYFAVSTNEKWVIMSCLHLKEIIT